MNELTIFTLGLLSGFILAILVALVALIVFKSSTLVPNRSRTNPLPSPPLPENEEDYQVSKPVKSAAVKFKKPARAEIEKEKGEYEAITNALRK